MNLDINASLDAVDKASNVLPALLSKVIGPRLEFIQDSRYEKQIKKEIDSLRFKKRITKYQENLAYRVSYFSSLAFPNHSLSISNDYEPITLIRDSSFGLDKQLAKTAISQFEPGQGSVFLIDSAGMGKTTYLKYYCSSLLFKSKFVPILLELRSLTETSDLVSLIIDELDLSGGENSIQLVEALSNAGKITLLLDGYDEISSENQVSIANTIAKYNKKFPFVSIVITSRPLSNLPNLIDSVCYKFAHFTRKQAENLLLRHDKFISAEYGKNLIVELNNVPALFIENPLLIALLYRSYAINGAIAGKISTFYIDFYNALYQGHDLHSKDHYVRDKLSGLDISDFRKVVRAFSHYCTVDGNSYIGPADRFVDLLTKTKSIVGEVTYEEEMFIDDITKAVPLVVLDGHNYRFLHKTISEYFSAEYILHSKNRDTLISRIYSQPADTKFSKVIEFIYDLDSKLVEEIVLEPKLDEIEALPFGVTHEKDVVETLKYLSLIEFGFYELDSFVNSPDIELSVRQRVQDRFSFSTKVTDGKKKYRFVLSIDANKTDRSSIALTRLLRDVPIDGVEFDGYIYDSIDEAVLGSIPKGDMCYLTNSIIAALTSYPFFQIGCLELLRKFQNTKYPKVIDRVRIIAYRAEINTRDINQPGSFF